MWIRSSSIKRDKHISFKNDSDLSQYKKKEIHILLFHLLGTSWRVIKQEVQDEVDARPEEGGQKNVSRQAFMLCNPCEC